jgi:hypothetical protein
MKSSYLLRTKGKKRGAGPLALLITLAVNVILMLLLYVLLMTLEQGIPNPDLFAFSWLLFAQLMLLTAWATLFSAYSAPTTATAFTLSVFVIGHLADDIWLFGQQADQDWVRGISAVLYWILPNFEIFNVRAQTVHELPIGASYVLTATSYGLGYTAVVLALAMFIFRDKDF